MNADYIGKSFSIIEELSGQEIVCVSDTSIHFLALARKVAFLDFD